MRRYSLPGRRLISWGLLLLLLDLAFVAAPLWFLLPLEPRVVIDGKWDGAWLSPDGHKLVTVGGKLWDTHTGKETGTFPFFGHWPTVAPDRRHVAAVHGGSVTIADWQTGRQWSVDLPGVEFFQEVQFSPDSKMLVVRWKKETGPVPEAAEPKTRTGEKATPEMECGITILETATGRTLESLEVGPGLPNFVGNQIARRRRIKLRALGRRSRCPGAAGAAARKGL